MIYRIIIQPIVYLMEMLVYLSGQVFGFVPMQIFILSTGIFFITFPMYSRAEQIQETQRLQLEHMQIWVNHIRRVFRKEERVMVLNAYYKQNHYHPLYALKSLVPLMLQAVFFVAAYRFLDSWDGMREQTFLWVKDLSEPDCIPGSSIHLLPIIMTLCNILSGVLYTKGHSAREKVQVYGLAVLFLILLYTSPSGMVLYWTFNNLLSLVYHFLEKCKEKRRIVAWAAFATGIVFFVFLFESGKLLSFFFEGDWIYGGMCILILLLLFRPMYCYLRNKGREKASENKKTTERKAWICVITAEAVLVILMGALIPAAVISASPLEFVNYYKYHNPIWYVLENFAVFFGLFLIWGTVFYCFLEAPGQILYERVISLLSLCSVVNYFAFTNMEGIVNLNLIFDKAPVYSKRVLSENVCIVLVLAMVVFLLRGKGRRILLRGQMVIIAVCLVFVTRYAITIEKELRQVSENVVTEQNESMQILQLSTEGHNVVVIMLDRAISAYIPYIFEEKPELKEQFDGFTWYPNTVSHGGATIFGMPSLFGGYEYTPYAINERVGQSVEDKLNEALCVMPILFGENGYDVTVCDPPYAGFSELPDLSIYDPYDYVNAYRLWGRFSGTFSNLEEENEGRKRSFFYYSLMEVSPIPVRSYLYTDGWYMRPVNGTIVNPAFMDSYCALENLSNMTAIRRDSDKYFLMMANNSTHSPSLLQVPDYTVPENIEDSEDKTEHEVDGVCMNMNVELGREHYHVNMAAMLKLGEWFDYLREQDIYDNTRIIIVSDHGYPLGQFEYMKINSELDVQGYNPLLLVKDFGANGFSVDHSFMTNADVPALAMQGEISEPRNPFTENRIDMSGKKSPVYVTLSEKLALGENKGNQLNTDGASWYTVRDSIFAKENWEKVENGVE